jgi:hypothetical protein
VTAAAIADRRQIAAAPDQFGVEGLPSRRRDGSDRRPPRDRKNAAPTNDEQCSQNARNNTPAPHRTRSLSSGFLVLSGLHTTAIDVQAVVTCALSIN